MTNLQTLFVVLAVLIGVGVVLAAVLPALKRRGVDVHKIIGQTKDAIKLASETMDILRPFVKDAVNVDVFDRILGAAQGRQL